MDSVGKKFEERFRKDFINSFNNDAWVYRLPDQISGYKTTSQNPCDFVCFTNKTLFLIECKTTKENTFNFNELRQYDLLLAQQIPQPNTRGVVIWFYKQDTIIYAPIETIEKMKRDEKKSINCKKTLDGIDTKEYNLYIVPSQKLRTFMRSDYKLLWEIANNDTNL